MGTKAFKRANETRWENPWTRNCRIVNGVNRTSIYTTYKPFESELINTAGLCCMRQINPLYVHMSYGMFVAAPIRTQTHTRVHLFVHHVWTQSIIWTHTQLRQLQMILDLWNPCIKWQYIILHTYITLKNKNNRQNSNKSITSTSKLCIKLPRHGERCSTAYRAQCWARSTTTMM